MAQVMLILSHQLALAYIKIVEVSVARGQHFGVLKHFQVSKTTT